ncbi:ribosome recycling factor-domain-containing protein [Trichophaea hybrida]|nr:ribosome recycling factor-domain-containing protein [Trichophaea hybrida]
MNRTCIPRFLLHANPCKLTSRSNIILLRPIPYITSSSPHPTTRTFTSTPFLSKKNAKKGGKGEEDHVGDYSSPLPEKNTSAAIDFNTQFEKLEGEIARIMDKLKDDLSKLRAGQADPGLLEGLSVVLDKAQGTTAPLKDVAHVVTRGRGLAVTVYEATNVKRVVSAIQIADLNVQPIVDAKNPLLVNVPLPPPTRESRDRVSKQAKTVGDRALDAVKSARLVTHKKIMSAKKSTRPDDFKKADKKVEEIVKKRKAEMEAVIAAARKGIMEG